MNIFSILIADSSETSRKKLCELLTMKGYKLFQATDGAGAIRISRSIFPDLVIMDVNLWGIQAYEAGRIIEEDRLSTVLFVTNYASKGFYEKLQNMNVYAYIMKPIQQEQLYQTVEFTIRNAQKISSLEKKVASLEHSLESRKKIDRAKGILMEKLSISENEAYKILRKESMDQCISMDKMAEKIIKDNK
ncbi:response regulator NasT [Anaerosolibacter carboniphilus]|uniref:Stage 0 sporulation protein A homolog n=1 Tax=Anaerosolibacter carboniphilus TaxID=1417629 RepID=A0A841L1G1_9FIRM|nr:ANTAR domain-containing protein [Anaerosolibacter carboniphilus]MBB6216205.1 response regulator NasT [Anaerosolibacter carboniphilus]